MNKRLKWTLKLLWIFVLAIGLGSRLPAQNIAGYWQGTLMLPQGNPMRMILQVLRVDSGPGNSSALKARIYSIDQSFTGDWADSITKHDSTVKFVVGMVGLSYEGKLSSDGETITGMWVRGGRTPFIFQKASKETAWAIPADPVPHKVQFVTVEPGVKLEVLDWGGAVRPLVFLASLGDTAHAFDQFALKFTSKYHVFGITRRGFGESSYPTPNNGTYSSDRLGDDVLVVIAALHLDKPVLVGHSIAGEELSSIGSRHPEKVSGLIYLECSGPHSFYDRAHGDLHLDMIDVRNKIEQLLPSGGDPSGPIQPTEALSASLPQLEKELQDQVKLQRAVSPPTENATVSEDLHPTTASAVAAIISGEHKYTEIKVPCLAFFAVPHDLSNVFPGDATRHAAVVAADLERQTRLANAFEAGVPSAKIVRLPNASHYVFRSNEAEVIRAMNDFLGKLSP